jgi:hypothetical protein
VTGRPHGSAVPGPAGGTAGEQPSREVPSARVRGPERVEPIRHLAVLAAAAVPGLLFEAVFGLRAVVVPIAVVLVACALAGELCRRVTALGPWRPLLALAGGLLVLAETQLGHTTHGGLPTGATIRALVAGATESWQLTLQSTWPARPDAELLLFVPLAVLVAAVLGIELLRWPLVALLPSLLLLGLSQAYLALTGTAAAAAALGYAAVAATLLAVSKKDRPAGRAGALMVLPTAVLGVVAAVATVAAGPVRQPAYSLRHDSSAPVAPTRLINPLTEVAARMQRPDVPVFSYRTGTPVDRWRLAVLNRFDGVSWSTDANWLRMGATVEPAPTITVPTGERSASVAMPAAEQPWIPSQALPAAVSGVAPLIDQDSGMLLVGGRSGPVSYELRWREPAIGADALAGAAIDSTAAAGLAGLGQVPAGVDELAREATGGQPPSFQTAVVLERFLSRNYQVATGPDLPTGSGWPQLRTFLLETRRGTSEQFAAAYVVLARQLAIPARLVYGFRAPPATREEVVVRNGNVLVWPEVAVADVGWVPLDPTGTAGGSSAADGGLAEVTAQVRAALPPLEELRPPRVLPHDGGSAEVAGNRWAFALPVAPILLGLLVSAGAALAAMPLWRAIRTRRRRRLTGVRGVVAAWWEVRDRLRADGVPLTAAMTVREVATVAAPTVGQSVVDGMHMLARLVDLAVWSGRDASPYASDEAWAAVDLINDGLGGRPLHRGVRAAFDPSSLFPPRPVPQRG